MDDIKEIKEILKQISSDIVEIKITQAEQGQIQIKHEETLAFHVKRSNMLEDLHMDMKEKEIEPIKADINQIKGAFKFIGIMITVGSLLVGLIKLFAR